MISELINNKVYYKIFDKTYQQSSHIYAKNKALDANELIEINRNLTSIGSSLACKNIVILNQVHGGKIIDADQIKDFNEVPIGDGAVTSHKNIVLSVRTADCVPVLLASLDGKVIGAVHCGWKSAKADIISNIINIMQNKGAEQIKGLIGPAIQQYSYEVGEEYYQSFIQENGNYSGFFIPSKRNNHYMFDLPTFVEFKLNQAGVREIIKTNEDTYSNPEKYPSYRRDCHLNQQYKQNILSTIFIK